MLRLKNCLLSEDGKFLFTVCAAQLFRVINGDGGMLGYLLNTVASGTIIKTPLQLLEMNISEA